MFIKISQNSQENTCARVSVPESQSCRWDAFNFIEKENLAQVLSYKFCEIFKNTLFSESVKTNKSPGYDELSSNVIKNYFTELNDSLKYLLGNSISGQGEGNALKITRVTPLFKGGDPSDISNYKPISLLPCLLKILECIIYIYSWVPNRRVGRRVGITAGLKNSSKLNELESCNWNKQVEGYKILENLIAGWG